MSQFEPTERIVSQEEPLGDGLPQVDRLVEFFRRIEDFVVNSESQIDYYQELEQLKTLTLTGISKSEERLLKRFGRRGVTEILSDTLANSRENPDRPFLFNLKCVCELSTLCGVAITKKQRQVIQRIFTNSVDAVFADSEYQDVINVFKLFDITLTDEQTKRVSEMGGALINNIIHKLYQEDASLGVIAKQLERIKEISEEASSPLTKAQQRQIQSIAWHAINVALDSGQYIPLSFVRQAGIPLTKDLRERIQKVTSAIIDQMIDEIGNPFLKLGLPRVIEGISTIHDIATNTAMELTETQKKNIQFIGLYNVSRAVLRFIMDGKVEDSRTAKEVRKLAKLTDYIIPHHQEVLLDAMAGIKPPSQ